MTDAPTLPGIKDARAAIAAAADGAALSALAGEWRSFANPAALLELADALWANGSESECIVAAKLLTKSRMEQDAAIWATMCRWAEGIEAPGALPALATAGSRRVSAHPDRMAEIAHWVGARNRLTRAAALGFAQGLAKGRHPSPEIAAARQTGIGWATHLARDPAGPPRKAAADFLLTLAKHDAELIQNLIETKASLPEDLLSRLKRAASR